MKIVITGGTGFLGRHLARALPGHEVILFGRNNKQNQYAKMATKRDVYPVDITSMNLLTSALLEIKPDLVIHAAATKFVDLSEKHPAECIEVNTTGSLNVLYASRFAKVKQVLAISTDKAAPPVRNTYGLSKALMEKLFTLENGKSDLQTACVRYGNVVWSTGSVFPIWEKMIQDSGVIKTTGPDMYRFFFTVDDAVSLVLTAMNNMDTVAGKILSTDMKAAQIKEVIRVWNNLSGSTWEKIDGRPGERNVEFLVGEAEKDFTEEIMLNGNKYFLLHQNFQPENSVKEPLHSANCKQLTDEEIKDLIIGKPWDV